MEQCPVGKKQSYEDENQHNRIWDQVGYASQTDHKKSQVNSQLFRILVVSSTGWEAMSTDAEGKHAAAATSKIRERAVRGSIRIKKVPVETEKAEARYRFWGLPTGVNMLPKFAPIVCKTMVEINSFCCPVIVRIIMPKGTNVSSDTSLVMNMLEKKHSRESTSINCRVVRTL